MSKIKSTRKSRADNSFDIWDDGDKNVIVNFYADWSGHVNLPLMPTRCMETSRRDTRWFRHVNYPLMALEMTLKGQVEYNTEAGTVLSSPGMVYVVARHSDVRIRRPSMEQCRKLTVLATGDALDAVAGTLGLGGDRLIAPTEPEAVERAMRAIGEGIREQIPAAELSAQFYRLLLLLAADLPAEPELLRPALAAIRRDPAAEFTVGNLAERCKISPATLRRHFIAAFGASPAEYLTARRLELSAALLRAGTEPVKAIALRCGIANPSRFIRLFRRRYGVTPCEFRAAPEPL